MREHAKFLLSLSSSAPSGEVFSLACIPKDVAKLIAFHAGSFFSLSSINQKFRGFFQKEREAALKKVKIFVKEDGCSSYLLTYDGKLYACGQNNNDHFGLNDGSRKSKTVKCYRQWTRIGPEDKRISEVVLSDENSIFVRCGFEWYGAGSHPYIRQIHREKRSVFFAMEISPWVSIGGPEPFSIRELIPTPARLFIACKDDCCYELPKYSQKIMWQEMPVPILDLSVAAAPALTNVVTGVIEEVMLKDLAKTVGVIKRVESKQHVFACHEDGWYFAGDNTFGQNGMNDERWRRRKWIKILSHGESIEEALEKSLHNIENKKKEPLSLRFRRSLRKMNMQKRLSSIEIVCEILQCGNVKLRYPLAAEEKYCFHFFLADEYYLRLAESEQELLKNQLVSMCKFPVIAFCSESQLDRKNTTTWVRLTSDNCEAICQFLKGYEEMLDEYEQEFRGQFTFSKN